ncbi:MAG: hypothetical protein ABIH37_02725 [archaeon]
MDVKDVLAKYSRLMGKEMQGDVARPDVSQISNEYVRFKEDMMPEVTRYEKWVNGLGKSLKIRVSQKDEAKIRKDLNVAHIDVEPSEVVGLAIMSFILVFFLGSAATIGVWFFQEGGIDTFPIFFIFLIFLASGLLAYYLYTAPTRLAVKWRLKASSQMVPAVLYTVIYMKHTSNLERAISFVAQHVEPPLSLDFKKVIWDVETGRFSNIKDSLNNYLDFWKDFNMEFVESFHLIESSLYEPHDARRIRTLERSLQVILDGVYEKMLKYTHSIKAPLTNLYMLGIVLPTLGLALLPLASTLLGGAIKFQHVLVLFNLIVPFFVFYLVSEIMLRRPGGYGQTDLLEKNPNYPQYASKRPYFLASLICIPLLIIGFLPLIFGYTPIPGWLGLPKDFVIPQSPLSFLGKQLFEFRDVGGSLIGPFSGFALMMSLLIPLSIALFFIISFKMRTKELIKSRDDTESLEKEFNNSLFTLGNRLGDGTPAEIAFAKVADSTKGQKTADFFNIVNTNIRSMGMSIESAIFDSRRGALVYYPSNLIATSMRILIESVKKGLKVAAQSLMSISEYVKNIQKINERLNDLLAEVVSDMKSNMTFLAPLLAGIVVGLSAMITGILGQLKLMTDVGGDAVLTGLGNLGTITQLFDVNQMIPPYFMQISIGIYIIEIIFILTTALVTVDVGEDRLRRTHDIGKNLSRGGLLYLVMAFMAIGALSMLSSIALRSMVG